MSRELDSDGRAVKLDEVLVDYMRRVDRGEPVDQEALIVSPFDDWGRQSLPQSFFSNQRQRRRQRRFSRFHSLTPVRNYVRPLLETPKLFLSWP
jgi:hypothetical protein